jgi:energy-coupling factor transport system permease protein
MYHTVTWLIWLVAALFPAVATRNPFYLLILLLAVAVPYNTIGRASPLAASWRVFLRAGLVLVAFSVLFNVATSHHGQTALLTVPRVALKISGTTFLDLGGKITLEALAYGLTSGLNLMVVLLIFATFNALVDHHQMLRAVPAFLYQTATVASIAVTFVPQMVSSLQDIREAQAVRGHRFRGVRDLLPLFVPLLSGGLERAIQLAESMEARGFGGGVQSTNSRGEVTHKVLILSALFGPLAGAFLYRYFAASRWVGAMLALGSVLVLVSDLVVMGRQVKRSRYRRELWRRRDTVVTAASLAAIATMALIWSARGEALLYYPYPRFSLPTFNPLVGLASLVAIVPVFVAPRQRRNAHDPAPRRLIHIP